MLPRVFEMQLCNFSLTSSEASPCDKLLVSVFPQPHVHLQHTPLHARWPNRFYFSAVKWPLLWAELLQCKYLHSFARLNHYWKFFHLFINLNYFRF